MGWLVKIPAQVDVAALYNMYSYGGNLYLGSGNKAKLLRLDSGGTVLTKLTSGIDMNGSSAVSNLRYSTELGKIVGATGARVDTFDDVSGDWKTTPSPLIGYLGDHFEITGAGKIAFGGGASNDRRVWTTDTESSSFSGSQQLAAVITKNVMYNGKLYCLTDAGELWEWNGSNLLVSMVTPVGESIVDAFVYDSSIYAITAPGRLLYWNGGGVWTALTSTFPGSGTCVSFTIHNGEIYIVTSTGRLGRYDGSIIWETLWNNTEPFTVTAINSWAGELLATEATTGNLLQFLGEIEPTGIPSGEGMGTAILGTYQKVIPISVTLEGDIRLVIPSNRFEGEDIQIENREVVRDPGLETSVLISILTDRRAGADDILPDNTGDKRGWWGDALNEAGDADGSLFWLYSRSGISNDTIFKIEESIIESLQWMKDDGLADEISVSVIRVDTYQIDVNVTIHRPTGDDILYKYYYNWEYEIFGRA